MIDRRTLMVCVGTVTLAPALTLLPTQHSMPDEAAADRLILLIEGWSASDSDADDVVSIRIDRAWRTAWR